MGKPKTIAEGFMADYLEITVLDYADKIESNTFFTQANYGDGEWACILGKPGGNGNSVAYTPEIARDLIATLKRPQFTFFGSNPGWGYKPLEAEVKAWIGKNDIAVPWMWKETLSSANIHGHLGPFIKAFRGKRVGMVGPPHLADFDIFDLEFFIEVPKSGAYGVMNNTVNTILERRKDVDIITFSSGMATNIAMHKLMESGEDMPSMIDCGALWDPYVRVCSRSGYRKREFLDVNLPKNIVEARVKEVCPRCGK